MFKKRSRKSKEEKVIAAILTLFAFLAAIFIIGPIVLIGSAVLGVAYLILTGMSKDPPVALVQATRISPTGKFKQKVVGEYFNREGVLQVAGTLSNLNEKIEVILLLETDNTHDKNAVGVYHGSIKMGHLSKEDAILFRQKYAALGSRFSCLGKITERDEGRSHFGVVLDIPVLR